MMDEEMIIGKNPVFEALKSNRTINKILISNQLNERVEKELKQSIIKKNTVLQKVPRQRLDQLTKGKHQGMIAYVSSYEYVSVQTTLANEKEINEDPFIVILEEFEDLYYFSTIIRTADTTVFI